MDRQSFQKHVSFIFWNESQLPGTMNSVFGFCSSHQKLRGSSASDELTPDDHCSHVVVFLKVLARILS